MGSTAGPLVGREDELTAVAGFLDSLQGPAALVLEGGPGIGKTRIWQAAVEAARQRGFRVLVAHPSGSEIRLALAALGDLLADLPPAALDQLPDPQRRALRVAALVEEPHEGPSVQRLIGTALLGALRAVTAQDTVVVAIDDVQWLDAASTAALSFAARRLRDERVGFMLTTRAREGPTGLDEALPDRIHRLVIGPLSMAAVQSLVRERLGSPLPRPLLRRLWEASRGNPLHALELGRVLLAHGGRLPEGGYQPATPLFDLLRWRVAALPPSAQDVLLAAAVAATPSLERVRAVTGADAWERLRPAVEAQLLELDGTRLRFAHPLVSAVVLANADPARRRELHLQLAGVVSDPEERARHLALAAEATDADAAAALDAAAGHAEHRGAPHASAELLELAVRLTPTDHPDDAVRRALGAARAHQLAGDASHAESILRELIATLPEGPRRAEALLGLMSSDTTGANRDLAEQALREAGEDARLRASILIELAQWLEIGEGPPAALGDARQALALAEQSGDESLVLVALSVVGHLDSLVGGEDWLPLLQRAVDLQAGGRVVPPWLAPRHWIGARLMWADEVDEARGLLLAEYGQALALGDEASRSGLCLHLTQLETRAGDAERARAYAGEGWEIEEAGGREQSRATNRYALALVEAHFGDPARAQELAVEALAVFERLGDRFFTMHSRGVLAFLALGAGDYEAARRALDGLRELRTKIGIGEPGIFPFDADEIEALVGVGRLDEAQELAAELAVRGQQLDRPRLLATGHRCTGLVLASGGQLDEAVDSLDRALAEHDRLAVPVERARTLLTLGAVQRRARRKRVAREALDEALALFSRLGSAVWVQRTRAEIARIGGRTSSGSALTAGEQRVAALVAQGRTNKEVAAELFITVNTVETTLRRVYAKLGVRSRGELAHRFAVRG